MKKYDKVIGEVIEEDEIQGRYVREEKHENVILLSLEELRDVWDKGYVRGCEEAEAKSHGDYGPLSIPNFTEYLQSKGIKP